MSGRGVSAWTGHGEWPADELPDCLQGVGLMMAGWPKAREFSWAMEDGETFLLKRLDDEQLTREQMWSSHWTRPYKGSE